jgi:hypothetical protein
MQFSFGISDRVSRPLPAWVIFGIICPLHRFARLLASSMLLRGTPIEKGAWGSNPDGLASPPFVIPASSFFTHSEFVIRHSEAAPPPPR